MLTTLMGRALAIHPTLSPRMILHCILAFTLRFTARTVTIQLSVDVLTPLPVTFHCFGNRRVVDAAVLFVVRLKSPSVNNISHYEKLQDSVCTIKQSQRLLYVGTPEIAFRFYFFTVDAIYKSGYHSLLCRSIRHINW